MKRLARSGLLLLCACGPSGSSTPSDAGDAGADVRYGHKSPDASSYDAKPEAAPKVPYDRMTNHGGPVVSTPHVRSLYVGSAIDMPKNFDALLAWMVTATDYWSILAQYGVGYGTFEGNVTIDPDVFFHAGDVQQGFVDSWTLSARFEEALAALGPNDAGAEANAWVVFLPSSINVDLGVGKTCSWAWGYHTDAGGVPYSVIPHCGASGITIAHEMAEMVTDPFPLGAWYSSEEVQPAGGEIGDLCNYSAEVDGHTVTQLWSNADGDCEPQ